MSTPCSRVRWPRSPTSGTTRVSPWSTTRATRSGSQLPLRLAGAGSCSQSWLSWRPPSLRRESLPRSGRMRPRPVRIDPSSRRVAQRLATSAAPTHVAASAGQLWFSAGDSLWRAGSGSETPVRVDAAGPIYDLAALGDVVFVAREGRSFFEGVVGSYSSDGFRGDGVPLKACSLAAGPSVGVWAADCRGVHRLEATPGRLQLHRYVSIPPAFPETSATTRWCLCDMATGAGALWVVGDPDDPRLWRIAPSGRIMAEIDLPVAPRSIAVAGGSVWITAPLDDVVLQVDAATNRIVRRVAVGRGAAGVVGGAGALWVASQLDGTVTRIDPVTGRVTDRIHIGGRPGELAFGDGGVWAAVDERS